MLKFCAYFTVANLVLSAFICYKLGTNEITVGNLSKTLGDVVTFCNNIGPKVDKLEKGK